MRYTSCGEVPYFDPATEQEVEMDQWQTEWPTVIDKLLICS